MLSFATSLPLWLCLWAPTTTPAPSVGPASPSLPSWAPLVPQDGPPGDDAPQDEDDQPGDEGEDDGTQALPEGTDYSSWVWWWQLNREPFLDLRAQLGLNDPTGAELLGQPPSNPKAAPTWGQRPAADVIRGTILPALFEALESKSSRQVITACLVAIARVGEDQGGQDRAQVLERIRPHLRSSDQQVVEAAIAALGILGNEGASGLLSELLLDSPYGQQLVADSKVRPRARAFAAYSLGLLGARTKREDVRRYGVYMLARALEKDKSATPDLGVACVRAIGMTPLSWSGKIPSIKRGLSEPPGSSREAQVMFLLQILAEDELHRQIQAFVPTALAQLLNADEVRQEGELRQLVGRELLAKFEARRRTERELRRSSAMALGLLGSTGDDRLDERVVKALGQSERDRITQNWALMALGRLGGQNPTLRAEVRRSLLRTLKREDGDRAEWAALGLGLLERQAGAGAADKDTREVLIKRLKRTARLSEVGAFALALGLAGDPLAKQPVAAKLAVVEEPNARGHLTLALALLSSRDQVPVIQTIVEEAKSQPLLLRDSSTALALLGDLTIVERLVTMLGASHSTNAQAGLAQALGRLGDASSVEPLVKMLGNQKATENSRAYAAVALGLVADRDRLPWNTLISLDTNYSAAPPTLMDFDGHGILNLL